MTSDRPFYQVLDRGNKPYLMLLHGVMSSRAQWRANLDGLRDTANVVLVELLGHGRSPSPADPAAYRAQQYTAFFDALRADLGVESWFVCGQSFSAGLTMRYALDFPDRVRGQIFTNSVSGLAPPETAERRDERIRTVAALRESGRAALKAMRYYPRKGRLPDVVFDAMLADAELMDPLGMAWSMEITVPDLSMRDVFHQTQVPTLLVNGAWEKVFQPVADLAQRLLPSLQRVDVEGGHSVNAENPQGFNRAVVDFVRSVG